MIKQIKWGFLLFCVILAACEKWDLEEKVFLELASPDIGSISIDSVAVSSEFIGFTLGQVSSHGFVWSSVTEQPTITLREGIVDLGAKTAEDADKSFSTSIELKPNTTFFIRAYSDAGNQDITYSDVISYTTGNAMVFSDGIDYSFGANIKVTGSMSGMDKGFVAVEHGIVWSTENDLPTIDDKKVNLGERRSNDPFTAEIEDLENDQTHYFRAYAITSQDANIQVLYGQVLEFNGDLKSVWTFKSSIPGAFREGAISFSVGGKGYVGLGSFQVNNPFWEFDPEANTWSQTAGFPGDSRWGGRGFAINGKGYITTGANNVTGDNFSLNDLWEYDPQINTWTRKADLPAPPRVTTSVFVVNGKGYVCTGWNTTEGAIYNDLWEYDPVLDVWDEKSPFPGGRRAEAVAFNIGSKGYLGTGWNNLNENENDLWSYDPITDSWEKKASLPAGGRAQSSAFAIESLGKGYIVSGQSGYFGESICEQDIWSYDVQGDFWSKEITNFPAVGRIRSVAFSIGDKGYFGTGGCVPFQYAFNDIWQYDP